ncbi:MAG TPA: helix-turn-helix domain-containing protein [Sporichthyaceae bacterium]|nr:helix-turn-helix domain-containing protein [Sporichthyaceae bacterium]
MASSATQHASRAVGSGHDAAWVELIGKLAAGGRLRPDEAAADCLTAALLLLAADGAGLVDWTGGQAEAIAQVGSSIPAFTCRPSAGIGRWAGAAVATVSVDPRTDLIAVREGGPDFNVDDVALLAALAALVGWAGAGRNGLQQLLQGFVARPAASLDPAEVLTASAETAAHVMGAEIAGVLLPDATGEAVEMHAAVGNSQLATSRLRVPRGEGLAGRVLATGRAQRVADYTTDLTSSPGLVALSDIEGTCSAMAVPMLRDGVLVGVMCVWRRRRELFTEADEALFTALAGLCAAAVHNATAHATARGELAAARAERDRLAVTLSRADRTLNLQWALNKITRERGDLTAVLRTVGSMAACSATVIDSEGSATGWDSIAAPRELNERLRSWLAAQQNEMAPNDVEVVEVSGGWLVVTPVRAVGVSLGHLALGFASLPGDEQEAMAAQAALAAAVLLFRDETTVIAARRAEAEFVWDLLDGRLPDEVEASLRAQHLGSGFALPARVVAVSIPGATARATRNAWTVDQVERARAGTGRLITSVLLAAGCARPVLAARADLFAALVPLAGLDDRAHRAQMARAFAEVRWPGGVEALVGIGGRVDHVARFAEGWREALLAVSAATPSVTAAFEDLGVLQYLLAPTTRADLEGFAQRRIGELVGYDAQHGTDLVATLETYLDAECSTRRTAELMFVHHRTITYRLNRIEAVAGVRLRSPEDRLELQLALKIRKLGEGGGEQKGGPVASGRT